MIVIRKYECAVCNGIGIALVKTVNTQHIIQFCTQTKMRYDDQTQSLTAFAID